MSKTDIARQIFEEHLSSLSSDNTKTFRANVIYDIQLKTGASLASAAAMYNVCKKENERMRKLKPGIVGRKNTDLDLTKPWVVIDKISELPVITVDTKELAKETVNQAKENNRDYFFDKTKNVF